MPAKWWDTREVVAERREFFGGDFVSSREDAEREAGRIIDTRIGHMDAPEILSLGRVFNRHGKAGRVRYDRFSPGFAGAVMAKLAQNTVQFNEVVSALWRRPYDDALYLLGQMYADRTILPGAGSSLPSYLLYLRAPERFGICMNATMTGLGVEVGERFRADNETSYARFCEALVEWRREYGVAPQEADAILTDVMRRSRPKVSLTPVEVQLTVDERVTAEDVAAACHLPAEEVDGWVEALETGMRQAVFYGPGHRQDPHRPASRPAPGDLAGARGDHPVPSGVLV